MTQTTAATRREHHAKTAAPTRVRADIQALRALAVGLVVVYHFFPGRLSGGFVGVDVFFVISGFLITSHLLSRPPRSGRDLAEFWGRRIRRLLPASFVVLAVTLVATLLVAPQTVWENTAKQVAASVLYIENWFLAFEAVDYLAADNAASPVQHFWSLSVEEQFYLIWPVLLLVVVWLATRMRRGVSTTRAAGWAILGIVAVSFAYSAWLTVVEPASAYFVTGTRMWELGVGALAACIFGWVNARLVGRGAVRTAVAWVGLAMIVLSAFTFTSATPFPGVAAALPVVGTAFVLLAAVERGPLSPEAPMAWRPVQTAGDLSYSIYLWHWPAVILLPYALGHSMSAWQKLLTIVVVIGVSWITKVLIEDRFRGRKPLGAPLRRSYLFAVAGMVVIAGAALGVVAATGAAQAAQETAIEENLQDPSGCFGGAALVNPEECTPHGDELITEPVFAATDKPAPYSDGCWILGDFADQKTCHYGSDDADAVQVALIGNSHGGHWLPALEEIAATENWSITTYLISECYTVDVEVDFSNATRTENCRAWNERVITDVESGMFDLVVMSNRTARPIVGEDRAGTLVAAEAAFGRVLDRWTAAGVPTLILRDTPYAVELASVPDCVATHRDELAACDGGREREQADPLGEAAAVRQDDPNLEYLDLTDRICAGEVCYSVVGGVIVYFDRGHLSATFARSLAPDILAAATRVQGR